MEDFSSRKHMDTDYFGTFVVVGLMTFAIQLSVFAWTRWFDKTWRGLTPPVSMRQLCVEWIVYMVLFLIFSVGLIQVLQCACSVC